MKETYNNKTLGGYNVGILQDEELLEGIDSLLLSSYISVDTIQSRLHKLGLTPIGDIPTIIYGWGLFTYFYNQQNMNYDLSIEDNLKMSYQRLLNNPIINNYLASKVTQTIDNAAGVQ